MWVNDASLTFSAKRIHNKCDHFMLKLLAEIAHCTPLAVGTVGRRNRMRRRMRAHELLARISLFFFFYCYYFSMMLYYYILKHHVLFILFFLSIAVCFFSFNFFYSFFLYLFIFNGSPLLRKNLYNVSGC